MQNPAPLRKDLFLENLIPRLQEIENIDYWRRLNPSSSITNRPFREPSNPPGVALGTLAEYLARLREEGYFQTGPIIPPAELEEMIRCIDTVRAAGFPSMFALIYDVFYRVFSEFHPILTSLLGAKYKMIPNFWVYHVETSDDGKGFEPHRDAEYPDTIDADGIPTVLTLWIAITDATPLNSCMYVVPANRDPQYREAMRDLKTGATRFALEDIRALPAAAGTLSCWDQYLFHWGSRSSRRATAPRLSYAFYCQRGDIPPVDDTAIDLGSGLDFRQRLGLICRGIYRYSYLGLRESGRLQPLSVFIDRYRAALRTG